MSAAAVPEAAPRKGSRKLILIGSAVLLLLLLAAGGAAALVLLKKEAGPEDEAVEATSRAAKPAAPPVFMPLDAFTVNLADRDADRYAQVGITLQLDEEKTAERLKDYMPAIRNNILMVLSHKTAEELLTREGKERLAAEIAREAVRPMGIVIEPEEEFLDDAPQKKKRQPRPVHNPVQQVHFSNLIVQ